MRAHGSAAGGLIVGSPKGGIGSRISADRNGRCGNGPVNLEGADGAAGVGVVAAAEMPVGAGVGAAEHGRAGKKAAVRLAIEEAEAMVPPLIAASVSLPIAGAKNVP